jgi:hypothetical protein
MGKIVLKIIAGCYLGCVISSGLISCNDDSQQKKKTLQIIEFASQDTVNLLFENNCAACHGKDGTAGISGAANLQTSQLKTDSIRQIITEGRNNMPSFKKILNPSQIQKISDYVKNLPQ